MARDPTFEKRAEDEPIGTADMLLPAKSDPPALRVMKIVVIVLGIALVLGFFTVIGRMVYLASGRDASTANPAATAATGPQSTPVALPVSIPAGAEVRHIALDGGRLAVHLSGPGAGKGAILIVDTASGRVTSRVELVPADPLPAR